MSEGKLKFGSKKKFEPDALQNITEAENEEDENAWILPGGIEEGDDDEEDQCKFALQLRRRPMRSDVPVMVVAFTPSPGPCTSALAVVYFAAIAEFR
eukprot:5495815-Pyramimonas_sp.AAC.1